MQCSNACGETLYIYIFNNNYRCSVLVLFFISDYESNVFFIKDLKIAERSLFQLRFFPVSIKRFKNPQMEEERNARNNYDLVSAREGRALEIFLRIRRYLTAEVNRGMVWRTLASERAAEMEYNMNRLEAATGTDQSTESDGASQAAEGFGHHLIISGVCHRLIARGHTGYWLLEKIWDSNYEWRSNSQRYVRISTDENITVWWRIVTDWSRPDGNIFSMQALWTGNFSNHERVLQLIEDVNTANSIQFLSERVTLNLHMRGQHSSCLFCF